jgi:hypothetical protein
MTMSGRINAGAGLFLSPGYARATASSYFVFVALLTRPLSRDRGRIPRRGDYEKQVIRRKTK